MAVYYRPNAVVDVIIIAPVLYCISAEWTEDCGPGWEQHGQNCFMFRQEQKTWADARKVCKQNGGDLASISDAVEQSYITG